MCAILVTEALYKVYGDEANGYIRATLETNLVMFHFSKNSFIKYEVDIKKKI